MGGIAEAAAFVPIGMKAAFLVDRPKNHLLGRWVPRSALALDEKTSDATMMRVSIRIKKQRR
ncbi:MAG: hypothetical protein LKE98_08600 [Lachnospiraceae bacterium]|nr:hypothetical protein [Lachnospiraceae bacterium]MCI1550705.1 hypothetical protein [Lachnospiraceae bacterium]